MHKGFLTRISTWGAILSLFSPFAQAAPRIAGLFDNANPPESDFHNLPIFSILNSASRTLDIEVYEFTDYEVRRAIRSALTRGVRVRIIKDPRTVAEQCPIFMPIRNSRGQTTGYRVAEIDEPRGSTQREDGTESTASAPIDNDCRDQRKLVREVQQAGGSYVPFNKPQLCANGGLNCFQHGKMILADETIGLISSGNFNSSSVCDKTPNPLTGKGPDRCNRDYTFVLNSDLQSGDRESLAALHRIFEADLAERKYDVDQILGWHSGSTVSRRITVSPYSLEPLLTLIGTAKSTLVIQNQYLNEPQINKAILDAAQRGVKVYISLSSLCSFGKPRPTTARKAQATFSAFDQAGIMTSFFTTQNIIQGEPGYMHAKAIVVDGKLAWMGSVNGSTTSTSNNREFGVFFNNPGWVNLLQSAIGRDLSLSGNESWRESLNCSKDRKNGSHGGE